MDIVERLRRYRPTYGWPEERSVIVEPTLNHVAADEIERLREEIEHLHKMTVKWSALQVEGSQEIQRLRGALQHILTHCKSDAPPNAQALILFVNNALGDE